MNTNKNIALLVLLMVALSAFDCPQKTKIFVIGDSISIHYGPYLKKYTAGKFDYDRKRDQGEAMQDLDNPVGANGGNSRMVAEYLTELLQSDSPKPDIFLINCGLHDIKTNPKTGQKDISEEEYTRNIQKIIEIVHQAGRQMIWIQSTPVNDSIHNSKRIGFYRYNQDVLRYNAIADSLCQENGVSVIDLYAFSEKFPLEAYQDHVHYSLMYRELQGAYIAGFLEHYQFVPNEKSEAFENE